MKHYTEVLTKEEIEELAKEGILYLLDDIKAEYDKMNRAPSSEHFDPDHYFRNKSVYFCNLRNWSLMYSYNGASISRIIRKYLDEVSPEKCPKEGGFYGYKYCETAGARVVAELYIPEDAKRINPYFSDKCRCDKAIVKSMYHLEGFEKFKAVPYSGVAYSAYALYDPYLKPIIYYTGATVTPKNGFDSDRFNECAPGIHFFCGNDI